MKRGSLKTTVNTNSAPDTGDGAGLSIWKGRDMRIQMYGYPLAVGHLFGTILGVEIARADVRPESGACVAFRDSSYSAETGGFHPVEVAVGRDGRIRSIADFSHGGRAPAAELAKGLEFDFVNNRFTQYGLVYPIGRGGGLYRIWEANFCSYWEAGVYDDVKVEEDPCR